MALNSNAALYYDPAMVDSPKLCHDIFSILESRFLAGAFKPSFPSTTTATGKVRILSIDGGGNSGDLAAASLVHLESSLRRLSGNSSVSLSDYFDLAVGSGSGGILASLIFANNLSASDASAVLKKIRAERSKTRSRFGGLFKKQSKNRVIEKVFGEATLRDATKPILVTCYDSYSNSPFVFSRADAVEADAFDFKIRDVCAACDYKKGKKEVRSVDGETRIRVLDAGANTNPTAVGITHVMHNKQEFPFVNGLEDVFVLSIGGNGACGGDAVSVAGACQADMVDQAVAMAFGESRKSNYIRIQGNGINDVTTAEDVLSTPSVVSVLFQGKTLTSETNADRLECAAGTLIKEQRRRQSSRIPTVYIKPPVTPPRTSSSSGMTLTTLTGSSESPRY